MAKGLTIEIQGLNKALNDLKKFGKDKSDFVSNEIKATAYEIAAEAQQNLTGRAVDLGALRGSVRVGTVTKFDATVHVDAYYAAYVEFGTGSYAARYLSTQPKEIRDYAKQFFVNGKGYMPATPFFFPAVYKHYSKLIERLKKVL